MHLVASRRLSIVLLGLAVTLGLYAIVDRDGDGISDVWSALHPDAGIPDADPDGDGAANREEAIAGTDPLSATDRFAANLQTDTNGDLVLSWPSISGKRYRIESCFDLKTWAGFGSEFTGTGDELSEMVGAVGTTAPAQFWRVAVFDADADGDGLTDWEELQLGTDPQSADTDGDRMSDGWEAENGLAPLDALDVADDPDEDGIPNADECALQTDPSLYSLPLTLGGYYWADYNQIVVDLGVGVTPLKLCDNGVVVLLDADGSVFRWNG
ncbi:MAG: hypothetical protein QM691_13020 [Opitutaceae bacterium]